MLTRYLGTIRSRLLLGLLATVALGLSACGGSGYGSSSTPLPPAAGNQSAATPAGNSAVKVASVGKVGTVLTDPAGMTLYTFKPDTAGKSTCNGTCATTWPPLTITVATPVKPGGLTGDLGVTTRDDGTKQITFNGQPLYLFSGDKAAGDANGQSIGGVWFAASAQSGSPTATAATTSGYNYGY